MKLQSSRTHHLHTHFQLRASLTRLGWLALFLLLLPGLACNVPGLATQLTHNGYPQPTEAVVAGPAANNQLEAEVTFRVELPANTPREQLVKLVLLDDVTGLTLNARSFEMEPEDPLHFKLTLTLPVGSVLKYRYSRLAPGVPAEEHLSDGRQVRYRLYHVDGPGEVHDLVSRWTDTPMEGVTGRIMGKVVDASDGQPVPNMLVAAGGAQAFTNSLGEYILEGLPPGLHNLVAFALDGAYRTFQQGAQVAADSTTPADLQVTPAPLVEITFVVSVPEGTIPAVPLRMAGSLYQLGNTFASLSGGVGSLASRLPRLELQPDGRYRLSLLLPAGADIRYLYTLGDGFWNAEHTSNGAFNLRQIIVPDHEATIEDEIPAWSYGNIAPITFDVTVPADTPAEDYVSIQFKPLFGWTEPIPMWSLGNNRWAFVLLSPLDRIGSLSYRYCRNDQCNSADDARTSGSSSAGFSVTIGAEPQHIQDVVESWAWLETIPGPTTVARPEIVSRSADFMAGVEFTPYFDPSFPNLTPLAFDHVQKMGANWVVLDPTWSFTRINPPVIEPVAGQDPLWQDVGQIAQQGRDLNLNIALYPQPQFPARLADWWAQTPRDFPWWYTWFERYRSFALNFADLASSSDSGALILGGVWVSPALPDGLLPDGNPSGVPADAETRWRSLLQEVRAHFAGKILWALPYTLASNPPAFLDSVDGIYLVWSAPLSDDPNASEQVMEYNAGQYLDANILPMQQRFDKPIILAFSYPSADGGVTGCILVSGSSSCLPFPALAQPKPDIPDLPVDFQEQVDAYNAMLVAVGQRDWINGVISTGYYPPVALADKSTSVHGKPAEDVLAYWFPRLSGRATEP